MFEQPKYKMAYLSYISAMDKMKARVQKDHYYLQKNINDETRSNGLIIVEAYYGLDEHIYQIDAGILKISIPKDVEEFYGCQVFPVKKILTIKISNGQLVLNKKDFKASAKEFFNPCINKAARTLLYIRYTFRGLEKVLIYDLSRESLTIPHDVQ